MQNLNGILVFDEGVILRNEFHKNKTLNELREHLKGQREAATSEDFPAHWISEVGKRFITEE